MKFGIILGFDPSLKGLINSEIKAVDKIVELLQPEEVIFISCLKGNTSARLVSHYNFKYRVVEILTEEFPKVDVCMFYNSALMNTFMGGIINPSGFKYHLAISYYSNTSVLLGKCSDANYPLTDYLYILKRFGKEFAKGDCRFVRDNERYIHTMNKLRVNYDNVYSFGNGNRKLCDWISRIQGVAGYKNDPFYLGDDLFFGVNIHKDDLEINKNHNGKLFWLGFLRGGNTKRPKSLIKLIEKVDSVGIEMKSPHFFRGINDVIDGLMDALEAKGNVEISTEGIPGDNIEYFQYLNNQLAFLFIGKGDDKLNYVNKTIYDCYVAKIPVLMYQPTDNEHKIFGDIKCYFSTSEELDEILKLLKDESYRTKMIIDQHEKIEQQLQDNDIDKFVSFLKTAKNVNVNKENVEFIEDYVNKQLVKTTSLF